MPARILSGSENPVGIGKFIEEERLLQAPLPLSAVPVCAYAVTVERACRTTTLVIADMESVREYVISFGKIL